MVLMTTLFVFICAIPSFAYVGGLLNQKTMYVGSSAVDVSYSRNQLTDNNLSTYYNLDPSFGGNVAWLSIPVKAISAYRLSAASSSSLTITLFSGSTILKTITSPDVSDAKVSFPVVPGVDKVAIRNSGGTPVKVYEFDVYEAEPAKNVQINSYVASHNSVTLYFSGMNVNYFDIYRDGLMIDTVPNGSTSYVSTGLSSLTTYKFYVVGRNDYGESSSSLISVKTADVPPPPTFNDFRVFDVLDKSIRISFSFLNADRFEVYRNGDKVADLPSNATSYVMVVDPSTSYEVWVVGVNDYGRTASNVAQVTTQEELVPPSDPVLEVAGVYLDRVDLSISVKKAKTIKFYRDNRLINTISGDVKTYTDNTVESDKEYTYKFTALNDLGSVSSPDLKVKTLKPPVTDVPRVFVTPGSKAFIGLMSFSISSNDSDAKLYYSFDGTDWVEYKTPVTISESVEVYAKAVNSLGNESSIVMNKFVFQQNPKVSLGVDLDDVANAGERHFNVLWPIIAFCVGVVGAFFYGKRIRDMFGG